MIWKLCEKKSTKKSVKTALVMIFTLFDLFKFVRVFYWRILLSHFCVFFGFITMWRYWNSFPLERETVCSCRFHLKLIRVKFKQTLGRYFFTNSIRSIFTAFAIFKVMTCLPCVSFTSSITNGSYFCHSPVST